MPNKPKKFGQDIDLEKNKIINFTLDSDLLNLTNESQLGYSSVLKTPVWFNGTIIQSILDYKITDFTLPTTSLNMNSQRILNVDDPIDPNDVPNKQYVDRQFNRIYQELILNSCQLDNVNKSINQAISVVMFINMSDGNTFILTDGTNTETYEFDDDSNVNIGNVPVTIGLDEIATLNNLSTEINSNSVYWSSIVVNTLDYLNTDTLIIYRKIQSEPSDNDRIYGTLDNQSNIQYVNYNNENDYSKVILDPLPNTDTNIKTFGFGRVSTNLFPFELHISFSENVIYKWNIHTNNFSLL